MIDVVKVGGRYIFKQDGGIKLIVEIVEIVGGEQFMVRVLQRLPDDRSGVYLGYKEYPWEARAGSWEYLIGQDKP